MNVFVGLPSTSYKNLKTWEKLENIESIQYAASLLTDQEEAEVFESLPVLASNITARFAILKAANQKIRLILKARLNANLDFGKTFKDPEKTLKLSTEQILKGVDNLPFKKLTGHENLNLVEERKICLEISNSETKIKDWTSEDIYKFKSALDAIITALQSNDKTMHLLTTVLKN